jgi:hypothetical protein
MPRDGIEKKKTNQSRKWLKKQIAIKRTRTKFKNDLKKSND